MIIEATARSVAGTGPGLGSWKQAELAAGAFIAGYANERTRRAYRQDLNAWFRFLTELNVTDPVGEVQRPHFEVWMRRMEADQLKVSTIARRFGTASLFYEWLVDEEYLDRSPARKVKRPSVPNVSTTPWLSTRQFSDLLDKAEEMGGYTAATVLILGIDGLRISELLDANVEQVGMVNHHYVLNITRKGGKPATVPLPPRAHYALHGALGGRAAGPLILNRWGRRSTRECVQRVLDRVRKEAGITTRITPHGMRHSSITALLNAGVPIRDVQKFAGHASVDTTSRYDRGGNSLDRNAAYALSQVVAA